MVDEAMFMWLQQLLLHYTRLMTPTVLSTEGIGVSAIIKYLVKW